VSERNLWADHPLTATAYADGYRAGVEAAALAVRESWQSGYRGEVNVGFEYVVRRLINQERGE
jgi:hypothetical protein